MAIWRKKNAKKKKIDVQIAHLDTNINLKVQIGVSNQLNEWNQCIGGWNISNEQSENVSLIVCSIRWHWFMKIN